MSDKYKIYDQDKAYFITMTTVGWINVFTRPNQKMAIVNSLEYCQQHKGLVIYAWCLMPSHLHAILQVENGEKLTDVLRDFKKFTSKRIVELILNEPESRREWLLAEFQKACSHLKRKQKFKVWQDGNHAEIIFSNSFLMQKLNYIHQNPVKDMIVDQAWEYLFSSARNYAGLEALIPVELVPIEN